MKAELPTAVPADAHHTHSPKDQRIAGKVKERRGYGFLPKQGCGHRQADHHRICASKHGPKYAAPPLRDARRQGYQRADPVRCGNGQKRRQQAPASLPQGLGGEVHIHVVHHHRRDGHL